MFFDTWWQLLRVVVASACAYVGLIVFLRVSGKRTLAKLNAFDFVVTVALGSTLSSIVLSSDVAITEGLLAFAALIALQFVVARWSSSDDRFDAAVKSDPVPLVMDGTWHLDRIHAQRLSVAEVRQAIRSTGVGGVELVAAVVLETDGTLSVIPRSQCGSGDALPDDRRHAETS